MYYEPRIECIVSVSLVDLVVLACAFLVFLAETHFRNSLIEDYFLALALENNVVRLGDAGDR